MGTRLAAATAEGLAAGSRLSTAEAITRLIGAILVEQNDEWAVQRARYMTLKSIAQTSDNVSIKLPAAAA